MKRSILFISILLAISSLHAIEIAGDIYYCHDPSTIVYEDGKYWCFSTNNNLNLRYSTDLTTWHWATQPFSYPDGVPAYMAAYLKTCEGGGPWNLWAPDIIKINDLYYLYYSRNMCYDYNCTEQSVCGLAIGSSISMRDWVDQGAVLWTELCSDYRRSIDPAMILDQSGNLWLAAGSFGEPSVNGWLYGGIWLYQLDPETGMVKSGTGSTQIARPWIEAPYLYYKNGYYYLFFNQERCCSGIDSSYFIRYARSTNITGPYLDKEGESVLDEDKGSIFLGRDFTANYYSYGNPRPECGSVGREIGPGHTGIFTTQDGLEMFSFHFYDADNSGLDRLAIRTLVWGDDGWPRAGWDLADGDYAFVSCMNTDPGAPAEGLYVEAADSTSDIPQLWNYTGGTNQIWNFTRVGINQYKITCLANNKVLAVVSPDANPNNIYGPGKPVKLVAYDGSNAAHKWYVIQTNNRAFRMINAATSMALEVYENNNHPGAALKVNNWDNAQTSNQTFWLPPTGIYILKAEFGGLPASVANTTVGTRLTIATANGGNYQKWRFIPTFDGYNKIVNVASSLPLDLTNGSTSDYTQIRQFTDLNNNAQKWAVETLSDGSSRILNKTSGKVFTAANSTSGSYVNQLRWLHTLAQQWAFELQATSPNTRTWTAGGHTGYWSDSDNWDLPAVSGELLVFDNQTDLTNTNDLAADHQIRGIRFLDGAGAFIINGNHISLAGDILNQSAFVQTLNMPIDLVCDANSLFNAQSGDIQLGGTVSGNGGIIKCGDQTLIISAACSYSGPTYVQDGILKIASQDVLPASTHLTIAPDAVLDLNGFDLTVGGLDNQGSIIDSSCQGAILSVENPLEYIILPGRGIDALQKMANYWLQPCATPDWCMGSDLDQSEKVDMSDFADFASTWNLCE